MKNIQWLRIASQLVFLILTIMGILAKFYYVTILFFGITICFGSFYCGWVCPFGLLQDILNKLGTKLGIKKRKMTPLVHKILTLLRYIFLALVTLTSIDFIYKLLVYDPRVNFISLLSGEKIGLLAIVAFGAFIAISLLYNRPFCNYFCIEGAKHGLLSNFKLFSIKRNENNCVSCQMCNKACPMNIKVSDCKSVKSSQCINCFQCISSCPVNDTLEYSYNKMQKKELKKYLVVNAILLIVILTATVIHNNNVHSPNEVQSSELIEVEDTNSVGDASGIADGTYTGIGKGFRGNITVEVTIENEKITAIQVLQHNEDQKWFNRAYNTTVNNIVSNQSVSVDSVSGATYSSRGIINGVKDALNKARS